MTNGDAVISALDALRCTKLRSALTMLGIIIGVAAVIANGRVGGGAREHGGGTDPKPRRQSADHHARQRQRRAACGSARAPLLADRRRCGRDHEGSGGGGGRRVATYMRGNAQLIASGMKLGDRRDRHRQWLV